MRSRLMAIAAMIGLALSFNTSAQTTKTAQPADDMVRLATWMTGSFSSEEQAKSDTNFLDIRLHVVNVWPEFSSGFWLYVEQATAAKLDKPYRQRVYFVHQLSNELFESKVFTINESLRFAGEWQKPDPLRSLTADSLIARDGCSIILRKHGIESFVGSTIGKECPSELRGASCAVSDVVITATQMVSWDRGYDNQGKQVWGATTGGYIFRKLFP